MSQDPYAAVRRIFLEEAFEQLDRYQSALMRFELDPRRRTELDEAFRMLHNMKGSGAGVGWERLARVLHRVEETLEEARRSSRVPPEVLARLFAAGDAVGRLLDLGLARGGPPAEPEGDALSRLEAWPDTAGPGEAAGGGDSWPGRVRRAEPVRVDPARVDGWVELAATALAGLQEAGPARLAAQALADELESLARVPGDRLVGRLPRVARELARQLGKRVEVDLPGPVPALDRRLASALADPLVHLVRNAIDHGLEPPGEREAAGKSGTGHISIRVEVRGPAVAIAVEDDGRGFDPGAVAERAGGSLVGAGDGMLSLGALVPAPGASTRGQVGLVSGRGVGLNSVAAEVARLGGMVRVRSVPGLGTRFELEVPVRPPLVRMLLVAREGGLLALARRAVLGSRRGPPLAVHWRGPDGSEAWIPVARILGELDLPRPGLTTSGPAVEGMGRATTLPDGKLVPVLESWPVPKA